MSVNDAETLRSFSLALEIFPSIVAPPSDSALRAAQIDIAKYYFSNDWRNSYAMEEMRELDRDDESIPLLALLCGVPGHAQMSINYAAYELLKDGRFRGHLEHLPLELGYWEDLGFTFEWDPGCHVLPMVQVDPSLKILVVARDRPCGGRDHLWLEWNHKLRLTPAIIRDKWNAMPEKDRIAVSPKCSKKLEDFERGRETVKKGILAAKSDLAESGIEIEQGFGNPQS